MGVSLVAMIVPLFNARLPKLVLQGLEEHWKISVFAVSLCLLVLALALGNMLQSALTAYIRRMQGPFEDEFNLRMTEKRLRVDYDVLERKQFLTAVGGIILYSMILLRESVWISLLIILPAVLISVLKKKAARYDQVLRPHADEASRKMKYVEDCSYDFTAGKDIRIYNLSHWLSGVLKKEMKQGEAYVKRWENRYLAVNLCDALLCFARDAGAYLYLIFQIINGRMPVSDFVWYTSIIASCQQACSIFLENKELLGRLNFDYTRLRRFLESGEGNMFQGIKKESIPEKAVAIRLENVSFTYPGSEKPTLDGITITIQPGEKIALVGLNGAGKSTLVKLLCGLYHPTSGAIYVNDKPIEQYSRETYHEMLAVVFQDVKLLPLTIAQNVASQDGAVADRRRVRECLKQAGLGEMIEKLPLKEDTPLGRSVLDDGVELSGGERQKVWMARALKKRRRF